MIGHIGHFSTLTSCRETRNLRHIGQLQDPPRGDKGLRWHKIIIIRLTQASSNG